MSLDDQLRRELEAIEARGHHRQLRAVHGAQGAHVDLEGVHVLNLSSNNYLGLADHPALSHAARASLEHEGTGAGASRLIVGNLDAHRALEATLAAFHDAERALLFPSGYQANVGILPALAGPEDALFSDALNHASLIDGCRLSRSTTVIYPHRDLTALERLLHSTRARRRFIVTDTIFSMDGDLAPVADLRALADRHGAYLIVDEAHATGTIGPAGRGLCAATGVSPDVHLATLSKALGVAGAYVTGSRVLVDYLIHRARTFVFTTAPPPSLAAAASAAVALVAGPEGDRRRVALAERVAQLAHGLAGRGLLAPGAGSSPILPLLMGDERRALAATAFLLERGIYAQAIRPPTVPPGTSRLRISLMATHTADDIERALAALDSLAAHGIGPLA